MHYALNTGPVIVIVSLFILVLLSGNYLYAFCVSLTRLKAFGDKHYIFCHYS